jgi:hypothetical protein
VRTPPGPVGASKETMAVWGSPPATIARLPSRLVDASRKD